MVGDPGQSTFRHLDNIEPQYTGRFLRKIFIAEIDDVAEFDRVVRNTTIQNDVAEWCCQDWVTEALENLNMDNALGDNDYQTANEVLMPQFNRGLSSSSSFLSSDSQ